MNTVRRLIYLEAVRAIRDNSFDDMADTEGKGLDFSGGKWSLSGDHDNFDIYKRVISINAVKRDTDQNIVLNKLKEICESQVAPHHRVDNL